MKTIQETKPKKSEKTDKEQKPWLYKKGESGNPEGRPKGSLNFATKWRKFIEIVAKQNEIKPEEIDNQMMAVALKRIKEGNFSFWKDINDRLYGDSSAPMGGTVIPIQIVIQQDENTKEVRQATPEAV